MIISNSIDDTFEIAYQLAGHLMDKDVLCLHGEIGVGKTTFVNGLTKYFNSQDYVSSPTFAIMNIYNGDKNIYHFDFYRLQDEDEIYEAGLFEYIGQDGISVIEWPEILKDFRDGRVIDVVITKDFDKGEDYREIVIEGVVL